MLLSLSLFCSPPASSKKKKKPPLAKKSSLRNRLRRRLWHRLPHPRAVLHGPHGRGPRRGARPASRRGRRRRLEGLAYRPRPRRARAGRLPPPGPGRGRLHLRRAPARVRGARRRRWEGRRPPGDDGPVPRGEQGEGRLRLRDVGRRRAKWRRGARGGAAGAARRRDGRREGPAPGPAGRVEARRRRRGARRGGPGRGLLQRPARHGGRRRRPGRGRRRRRRRARGRPDCPRLRRALLGAEAAGLRALRAQGDRPEVSPAHLRDAAAGERQRRRGAGGRGGLIRRR